MLFRRWLSLLINVWAPTLKRDVQVDWCLGYGTSRTICSVSTSKLSLFLFLCFSYRPFSDCFSFICASWSNSGTFSFIFLLFVFGLYNDTQWSLGWETFYTNVVPIHRLMRVEFLHGLGGIRPKNTHLTWSRAFGASPLVWLSQSSEGLWNQGSDASVFVCLYLDFE